MHMHAHVYMCTLCFRSKIQDLNSEIAQMTQEIEAYNQESATYLTFEKRLVEHLLFKYAIIRAQGCYYACIQKLYSPSKLPTPLNLLAMPNYIL